LNANLVLSLRIDNSDSQVLGLHWQNFPQQFQPTITGEKGPTPGAIAVSPYGTEVVLTQLTTPGWCVITNLDSTNYVEFGILDPETIKFYPLGACYPGEPAAFRMSPHFSGEYGSGAGTSASGPLTNKFWMRANAAYCNVKVEVFEA
jgi:hypothetical protein